MNYIWAGLALVALIIVIALGGAIVGAVAALVAFGGGGLVGWLAALLAGRRASRARNGRLSDTLGEVNSYIWDSKYGRYAIYAALGSPVLYGASWLLTQATHLSGIQGIGATILAIVNVIGTVVMCAAAIRGGSVARRFNEATLARRATLAQAVHFVTDSKTEVALDALRWSETADGDIVISAPPAAVAATLHTNGVARTAQVLAGYIVDTQRSGSSAVLRPATEAELEAARVLADSGGLVERVGAPDRDGRRDLVLVDRISSTDDTALRIAAWAGRSGYGNLVAWEPYERRAVLSELTSRELSIRDRAAEVLRVKPFHVEARLDGAPGAQQFVIAATALRALTGDARVKVAYELRDALPDATRYWKVRTDAVSGEVTITESADALASSRAYPEDAIASLDSIPFGVTEDGRAVGLKLLESNLLLGGTPGSGKSGGATCLLKGISTLDNVAIIGLDPKRVELSLWNPRFSVICKPSDNVEPDEDENAHATAVLEALVAEMGRRYKWLDDNGLKKFSAKQLSPERPLLVVVIDELADLVSVETSRAGKAFETQRQTHIRRLIAKGRAAGVPVIAATQKPQSDVVPTSLRDLIQQRVGYATTTPDMTETILGKGMAGNGGLCHEIAASQKGTCYIVDESSRTPVRARTYWVPDEEVAGIAASTAHLRVDLPWLPQSAAPAPSAAGGDDDVSVTEKPLADWWDLPA